MRVLGRWLLYMFGGAVIVATEGHLGIDDPKGKWRSILLSFGGLVAALAGVLVWYIHRTGGTIPWPGPALAAWGLAACLAVGAWFSIASDLRREAKNAGRG